MTNLIPTSSKAEFHLSYRCTLKCCACSRASWLNPPHTEDMTIDDALEFFRQADAIGWKQMQPAKEKARIVLIGGEPTLNPDIEEFVKLCSEWSGTYCQIYSNGYGEKTRELLDYLRLTYSAAICKDGWKDASVAGVQTVGGNNWDMNMYVSPADAGLENRPPCYVHPSNICGISVDHDGYSICPIGASVTKLLNVPQARTKRLADLFDEEKAKEFTRLQCHHCGFEFCKRPLPDEDRQKYRAYAETCETYRGSKMSPTWLKIFREREGN